MREKCIRISAYQLAGYQDIRASESKMRNSDKSQFDIPEKGIAGFEKLWVGQKSHQLMIEVHDIFKKLPYQERFKTRDQLERSSSSVPDNIAEGHTSYYYQEKIKAFQIARKEAGESQNRIRSLQAKQYIKKDEAAGFISRYEEVIRGING